MGYNQVPVAEADRPKTTFCTPFGLFEWNCMPFGLCNAPCTFQRLMQKMFEDQQCQSLLLYLDDKGMIKVAAGGKRLKQQDLKAKLSKCCFFQREVRYLRHVISDQGISTDPASGGGQLAVVPYSFRAAILSRFCQLLSQICGGFQQNGCPSTSVAVGGTKSRKG